MPEPLKNLYSTELVESLSRKIKILYCDFNELGFIDYVMDEYWEAKELKDRMKHISESLNQFIPLEYAEVVKILMKAAPHFSGFEYMFFPGFIERYGLEEFDQSMQALEAFTQYSSSEFAVRPFIKNNSKKMMVQMELWAKSANYHVRRLASEGCRPRLPWAMALPEFKKDPSAVIKILEMLKNDESEYVRRSVANNLNDISKDNPQLVIIIAKKWLGKSKQTDKLVKHACRSLLKQGQAEIMQLFGFEKPSNIKLKNLIISESVEMGENLVFSFDLKTQNKKLGKLRIEYGMDFVKKNGSLSRKVFQISESNIDKRNKSVRKSHSFKMISTRKYYAGEHQISIIVNGQEMASIGFILNKNM